MALYTYAAYSMKAERMNSSSGGIFYILSKYIFENHGIVYGVAMTDDCYNTRYMRVENITEFQKIMGSKYLQAKMGNTFKEVKNDLDEGKLVMFSGTGCQINGLKNFLQRDYENLICVDVICHGVPSPKLWKAYVKELEKDNGKLKNINFRYKEGKIKNLEESQLYISKDKDSYMRMFLRDYSLRESCYNCVVKLEKKSDITLGDFWGIEQIFPEMNDGKGTSLVIVRTKKGQYFFDKIKQKIKIKEIPYNKAVQFNPSEYKSSNKPQERNGFYRDLEKESFEKIEEKYASDPTISWKRKGKNFIKKTLKVFTEKNQNRLDNSDYGLLFTFQEEKS